jgi:hypothetical protein
MHLYFSFILFIVNSEFLMPTPGGSLIYMLILGIGGSGIAFLSFYSLIDDVGAIFGSITVYIIPIFSVIFWLYISARNNYHLTDFWSVFDHLFCVFCLQRRWIRFRGNEQSFSNCCYVPII